jgi:hypothetical protein
MSTRNKVTSIQGPSLTSHWGFGDFESVREKKKKLITLMLGGVISHKI